MMSRRNTSLLWTTMAVTLALSLGSCTMDPVHDSAVKALGGDTDLPASEFHRPGQPCVLCHSDKGPAESKFALGGTLYYLPPGKDEPVPVDGAEVIIVDAYKRETRLITNCRGNFFLRDCGETCPPPRINEPAEFGSIVYPFTVGVQKKLGDRVIYKPMQGHVGREPSCAACHKDPPFFDSPGHVYLVNQVNDLPDRKVPNPPACPPGGEP